MPQENQQQPENSELLEDIKYVTQANKDEISQLNARIRQRISEADVAGSTADSIIRELSNELGQLSVKVRLTEKAIRKIRPGRKQKSKVAPTKSETNSSGATMRFGTDRLAYNRNLLPIEYSADGISYLWSGSDPEIKFLFSLNRSERLGMQIRLFALIKPEYSKQLKVLVDGIHIKHRFSVNEGLFVLSCNLPPSSRTSQTDIEIILPATHSPKELGTSNDERKLGLAIMDISFGKTQSGLVHLLKRLKLKP